jgi:hypothetical protein
MIGRDSRDDLDAYGLWPWIGGLVLAGVIISIMFQFATPIS